MSLPLSIQNLFKPDVLGGRAARVQSSIEAKNLEAMLRQHNYSFRTKIHKPKRRSPEYVVMLLEST